jgi:hypothetical protein
MSLTLTPLLQRFAERSPVPVIARALIERCLESTSLDAWFERTCERQYTRTLLFSTVFELMSQVVFRQHRNVHLAYQSSAEEMGVSITSVYNKLNGLELGISAELVTYVATQAKELIEMLEAEHPPLLAGYRVKILDGNALGAREHRLAETRNSSAAPLPGKSLAVLDPALGLITQVFPCQDAYTQERALLGAVLETVQAQDLWIADRNFCTVGFIRALSERGAASLIREHEQVRFRPQEAMRPCGCIRTGKVAEQWIEVKTGSDVTPLRLRRIEVALDTPTRDGERYLYLFTTVPPEVADAATLAMLYLDRWKIETAFQKMTTELCCEVNTLAYPGAALFGFAVAAVAYNLVAVVMATLRATYGHETVDQEVSTYYLAHEMANMAESLETILDPEDWQVFNSMTLQAFAAWLVQTAGYAQLRKYKKHSRGEKKTKSTRKHDPHKPHVSVARVLAQRKKTKAKGLKGETP